MTELSEQEFQAQLEALERGDPLAANLPPGDAADLALAGRLLSHRTQPSPNLIAAVQRSMATPPPARKFRLPHFNPRSLTRRNSMFTGRAPVWQRVGVALVALALVVGITMVAFPSARAAVVELIRKIGGFTVVETEEYPETPEQRRGGWMNLYDLSPAEPPGALLPEQRLSLSEAQSILPFTLTIPTWAPDGYVLQDQVRVILPTEDFTYTIAILTWENEQQVTIDLSVLHSPAANVNPLMLVGTGGAEAVQIKGQEGVLLRGAWSTDTHEYGAREILNLRWKQGQIIYSLVGCEGPVSLSDLVHMAESIP